MSISSLKKWLQRPFYVWEYNLKRKWFLIGGIILFSILFKLVYYPGYFSPPINGNIGFYIAHTAVNFFVLVFMLIGLPGLFKGYFDDRYRTVKKEIYWFLLLFGLLTIGHAIIILIENSVMPIGKSLKESFIINISVGVFPIVIMLFLAYIRSLEIKLKELEIYNSDYLDRSFSDRLIKIPAGQGEKEIKLTLNDLIYIKSANNYSEVFYKNDDKVRKLMVRVPLSEIESNINCEYIYRIHRGYIVNFLEISKVLGNANKCSVKLKHTNEKVPVSRSRRSEMLIKLRELPIKIVA